jgi:hypothetical protein
MIEHPQLGIDLFLENVLFDLLSFVDQLLFSLDLATSHHKLSLFLPQFVSFHFEFPFQGMIYSLYSLLIPLFL